MIRRNQKLINFFNIVSDAGLIFLCYFAALFIRFGLMQGTVHVRDALWHAAVAAGYSLVMVLVYCTVRLYGSYRFQDAGSEAVVILLLNAAGVTALMALLYFVRVVDFSRLALFFFWALSSASILGKRACVRAVLRHYRKLGYNQKHVVVVGNGHFAHQYVQDVKANPHMGFTVDGYLSRAPRPELGKCLGAYEDLPSV